MPTSKKPAIDGAENVPTELPAGVTLEDAERMGELAEEDRRPSTRRVYRSKWPGFASFCAEREAEPLPASPEVVGAYLSKRSDEVSLSTIRQDVAAIRWMHERHGSEDPTDHAGVSRILDGINQTSDRAPEKKQAVLTKHVRAMIQTLPLEEPQSDARESRARRLVPPICGPSETARSSSSGTPAPFGAGSSPESGRKTSPSTPTGWRSTCRRRRLNPAPSGSTSRGTRTSVRCAR